MTELTDLSDTDALNTAVSGQSTEGNVANMGGMDNLQQAILGMLSRFRNANVFRLRDNSDTTKLLAFDLSGLTTAATETVVAKSKGLLSGAGITAPVNFALAASVAGNALTIALKGADGNDPSATNPVYIPFRNVTDATGTPTVLTVTAATSLVISSGSTLGFTNGIPGRIWIVAFNDGGTMRLGAVNCLSGTTNISPLYEDAVASSTAEGGAGAADSAQTFYTGTAVTSKAYTILGYFEWASGLATAGTWGIVPTRISLFGPGHKKPGDVVQTRWTETGAVSSGTTLIPFDDTIPSDTEGDEYMTVSITPRSPANILKASFAAHLAHSAGPTLIATICRDTSTSALSTSIGVQRSASDPQRVAGEKSGLASAVTSTAFKVRAGGSVAGTLTFNGQVATRQFGGTMNSFFRVEEIMA